MLRFNLVIAPEMADEQMAFGVYDFVIGTTKFSVLSDELMAFG